MNLDPATAPPAVQVEPPRPAARDRYLDMWRAAALVRVVTYHVFGWVWLTVLFPAMGLMFALAGSLMVGSLDRTGRAAVGRRLRRLLPPLWMFAAATVPVLLLTGWGAAPVAALHWGELAWWILPVRTPPVGSQSWAWAFNTVLWYIVTYLWLVVLSPALLAAFRRCPWPTLAAAAALPVLARFNVLQISGYFNEQATNVSSFLACWLLGFAHHDGLLRRIPARRYACGVVALAVAGATWVLIAAVSTGSYDLNRMQGANTLWSMAFVATVLRFRPRLDWLGRVRPLHRAVELLNARAVTVYLWHLPAGMIAALLLTSVTVSGLAPNILLRLAVVWLLIAVPVAAFGWVEDVAARRSPSMVPAGGPRPVVRPGVPRQRSPRLRPPRLAGSPWHRAMIGTVTSIAIGLGVIALNLWPALPTHIPTTQPQHETARYLSDQLLVLDDASEPGLSGSVGSVGSAGSAGTTAVTVDGEPTPHAVVARTPSRIRVHPPTGCSRLRAVTEIGGDGDDAAVTFAVRADGVTVFDSGARTRTDGAEQVDVALSPVSTIDLVATSTVTGASAVWADAHFLCAS